MKDVESDICIIGAGICGILAAQEIKRLRPQAKITIVEAGKEYFDFARRVQRRQDFIDYGNSPWQEDYLPGMWSDQADAVTMATGGWALHWEGYCARHTREDLKIRSLYGFGIDWPLEWDELEKWYGKAEKAMGVSGEPEAEPAMPRSTPYPMPALPLSYGLRQTQRWAKSGGLQSGVSAYARNSRGYDGRPACIRCDTCAPICPTGARYSPDISLSKMLQNKQLEFYPNTLVRRLRLARGSTRVEFAEAVNTGKQNAGGEPQLRFRAGKFVLALGKYWTPHLLLLSANERFSQGLANSSGLVGKYMSGSSLLESVIKLDEPLYNGSFSNMALVSYQYARHHAPQELARFRLSLTNRTNTNVPFYTRQSGVILADDMLAQWKQRQADLVTIQASAPRYAGRDGGITLDQRQKNYWGDPLPRFKHRFENKSRDQMTKVRQRFETLNKMLLQQGGKLRRLSSHEENESHWHSGGCRMSNDPQSGVCNSFGMTHDHDNLFIIGAPTPPNPGIGSETLCFVALSLRSAHHIASM